jgi:TonB-linked SusC/RagA family outer membrane protein
MICQKLLGKAFAFLIALLCGYGAQGQSINVTGTVKDDKGEALQGVTVLLKGTKTATTTDAEGHFTINVPSDNATLVFSYVGFNTMQVPLGGRNVVDITMTLEASSLQEAVVVGYGTKRKSDITGALSRISEQTLKERPVVNLPQAIQGKAAGVNVSSNIRPGEVPAIRIRGNRSLTASNDPLYVVDGIPIVAALGVTSFSINDINPNDIASVEILKDASATAIYGSRGANGVILITTKKGSKGKVNVTYNGTVTLDWYKSLTEWMDGGQWVDRWRESLMNGRNYQPTTNTNLNQPATRWFPDPFLDRDKMGLAADQRALQSVWRGYEWDVFGVTPRMRQTTPEERALGWPEMVPIYNSANVRSYDWASDAVRTGINQNHQVALSTGNDISKLYLSLGYNGQTGVQRDQNFERFNISMNGDINATKWLTLGISTTASLSEQNFGITTNTGNTGSKDLFSRALEQFPFALPKDSTGAWVRNPGGNLNLWNPLIDVDQSINDRRTTAIMANTFVDIKFAPWIKYRLNFGTQVRNFRAGAWTGPTATGHLNARPNTAGQSRSEAFSWVAENLLFIEKTFKDHVLNVTFLQSAQKSRNESMSANVSGTTIPLSLWYDLASNTNGRPDGYSSGFTENTLASYMARINYTFKNKYLLTASGRYDGSSVLASENKWDFFPSFALAWKMQEENFMQNINWLDELKPRVGWGVTGNSSVNPYTTTGPLSRNPYIFGSVPGIGYLPQLVQNPDLGWEKTQQLNIGLDFSLFRRRVSGSLEYYKSQTSDLILSRPVNPVSGYVTKFENVGKTSNEGIELNLNTVNIDNKNWQWTTEINLSRNTERIEETLNGKQDQLAQRWFIGQPLSVFFHYDNAGIWGNSTKDLEEMAKFNANGHRFFPGTIRVVDQNGDYRINADDYVIRGSAVPRMEGGITNTISYKKLSLLFFIYARLGQTYFGGYPNSFGGANPNGRVENDVWGWENQGGRWPLPMQGAQVDNFTPAMQFNDGSFFVVRNISLTYDMPDNLIRKAGLKTFQLNAQILNPFMWGGDIVKMGLNPDDDTNWGAQSQPNSNATSPLGGMNNNTILPQSFVFGVRLGF